MTKSIEIQANKDKVKDDIPDGDSLSSEILDDSKENTVETQNPLKLNILDMSKNFENGNLSNLGGKLTQESV